MLVIPWLYCSIFIKQCLSISAQNKKIAPTLCNLFYVSLGASCSDIQPLLPHVISTYFHYLKLWCASWMTGFAFLRLCFSHHISLLRSLHFNPFTDLCGCARGSLWPQGHHIWQISNVSGETLAREKWAGHWHLPPLPTELTGYKEAIPVYVPQASPGQVSGEPLGHPQEKNPGQAELWMLEPWFSELLRWRGQVLFSLVPSKSRACPALRGPPNRPYSLGFSLLFRYLRRDHPLFHHTFHQVFPCLSFWPKNLRCLRWVFYNCFFFFYLILF